MTHVKLRWCRSILTVRVPNSCKRLDIPAEKAEPCLNRRRRRVSSNPTPCRPGDFAETDPISGHARVPERAREHGRHTPRSTGSVDLYALAAGGPYRALRGLWGLGTLCVFVFHLGGPRPSKLTGGSALTEKSKRLRPGVYRLRPTEFRA